MYSLRFARSRLAHGDYRHGVRIASDFIYHFFALLRRAAPRPPRGGRKRAERNSMTHRGWKRGIRDEERRSRHSDHVGRATRVRRVFHPLCLGQGLSASPAFSSAPLPEDVSLRVDGTLSLFRRRFSHRVPSSRFAISEPVLTHARFRTTGSSCVYRTPGVQNTYGWRRPLCQRLKASAAFEISREEK